MYVAYAYAYPHKTAYRPLMPSRSLQEVWEQERRDNLFLYLHVPFCEMRCGFCNLFTTVNAPQPIEAAYLDALERQARAVRAALGKSRFARVAIGGGTPTYLSADELARLLDLIESFGVSLHEVPVSVESSPQTATVERLALLRERGVDRLSIGVQSFFETEVRSVGRTQHRDEVARALDAIRAAGFPTLNIDLIYGLPGQTVASWLESLRTALTYQPEELYLYPLYKRPLTGIDRVGKEWDDLRLACYRAARELLRSEGYEQHSMRMFRASHAPAGDGPVYCCQEDGMVGLGCGARSYTRTLHYSSEYAVQQKNVRAILADYVQQAEATFARVVHGFELDEGEQRRRYTIKSLLRADGLSLADYRAYFGSEALDDLPVLLTLPERDWATLEADRLLLNERGLEWSDTIGPLLFSERVQALIEEYDLQ